jgi:hypothetical protein
MLPEIAPLPSATRTHNVRVDIVAQQIEIS